MYGLIGKMLTAPGKRGDVIALMKNGTSSMPGCRAYLIAEDAADPDTVWITEAWESEAQHKASLNLPEVRAAIQQAMPFIVGMESIAVTRPILD